MKNRSRHDILYYYLFILSLCSYGDMSFADNVKEYTKIWTSGNVTGSISKDQRWKYYLEPQLRLIDDHYKFHQANIYGGIYYQTTPALSFWVGAFRRYETRVDGSTYQEYRLWEQMVWEVLKSDALTLSSRSRLEERKNFNRAAVANRLREKIKLELPIGQVAKYSVVLADEVFLQLNQPSWVVNRVFSQNRASIGIGVMINNATSCEVGYLNEFQYGAPNTMSNVLYLDFYFNMDVVSMS